MILSLKSVNETTTRRGDWRRHDRLQSVGRKAALLPCFDEKFTNTPTDGSNQCQSGGGKFEIPHTLTYA